MTQATYPSYSILGKTGIRFSRDGLGALPLQRLSKPEAVALIREAYENGINFYDTANAYSDSEEKLGAALSQVRENIIIATKSGAKNPEDMEAHLKLSLERLQTDYIDIYQFHNPDTVPLGDSPMYQKMLEFKEKGWIRHISITCHKLTNAYAALESGLYDTIQYPLSCLSAPEEVEFVKRCAEKNIGILAMKAMSGGLLTSARPSLAFLRQFSHVVPIWGWQRASELHEVLALAKDEPALDAELLAQIEKDKAELAGDFCRGCGYCLPCPAEIDIPMAARMALLLRRSPSKQFLEPAGKARMDRIESCIECGACKSRCPYQLDTPALLKRQLEDYRQFSAEHPLN